MVSAYIGSGLQLFTAGALIAWLPSYFNRYYDMPTAKAGATAGLFALVIGIGMVGKRNRLGPDQPARPDP